MNCYYDSLNDEIKEYFHILSPVFPNWLIDYIETKDMQRIGKISMNCGMDYTKCFNIRYFYSNLDHSVGVALIIWHFTYDKRATLAGLFHDIATPVFKHCIDFMNNDSEKQESTEARTTDIIKNSKEIMSLLKRDKIKLEEIDDYKKYPIADNEIPRLSADRMEYTFSSGLTFYRIWELDKIKKVYDNIVIVKNEDNVDELAFKDKSLCEEYISTISKLWPEWVSDKDRTSMQFIADICKSMNNKDFLTIDDLYTLSEEDVINKILRCKDKNISSAFKKFQNATDVYKSDCLIKDRYCVNVKSKTRYIVPLVLDNKNIKRINEVSKKADEKIKRYLSLPKGGYYTYFDFEFSDLIK